MLLVTAAAQVIIVECGDVLQINFESLSGKYWGISLVFVVGSLIMQHAV